MKSRFLANLQRLKSLGVHRAREVLASTQSSLKYFRKHTQFLAQFNVKICCTMSLATTQFSRHCIVCFSAPSVALYFYKKKAAATTTRKASSALQPILWARKMKTDSHSCTHALCKRLQLLLLRKAMGEKARSRHSKNAAFSYHRTWILNLRYL